MDELFRECQSSIKYDVPKDIVTLKVDRLITEIEDNYKGLSTIYAEREKEKEDLKNKLSEAEKKLSSIKNPNNLAKMPAQRREEISKKLSTSREELRKEIRRCKVRLDEIKIEEGDRTEPKIESKKQGKREDNERKVDDGGEENSKWNLNPYADFL